MIESAPIRILCTVSKDVTELEVNIIKQKLHTEKIELLFISEYDDTSVQRIPYLISKANGIIIFGGVEDISPTLYGETVNSGCVFDYYRDVYEFELLNQAIANNMPVVGICRGMQLINIYFGGSLKDIRHKRLAHLNNWESYCKTQKHLLHGVSIIPNTILSNIFPCTDIQVNSYHHQCVDIVGDNLIINAVSDDGIIEGLEHKDMPIIGLQWHVELMNDQFSEIFFSWVKKTFWNYQNTAI